MIGASSASGNTAAYATAGALEAVISSAKSNVVELPIAPAIHPLSEMKFIRNARRKACDDENRHYGNQRTPDK